MGLNGYKFGIPSIYMYTKQIHELIFSGFSCHRYAIFLSKMMKEINLIIVCQRNITNYWLKPITGFPVVA